LFWCEQKDVKKQSNTGIEIEQCRYLYFIAKKGGLASDIFQQEYFQGFPIILRAACVPVPATNARPARSHSRLCPGP
jgi:hypothetical protein